MTLYSIVIIALAAMIGIAYAVGQRVGFKQGRMTLRIDDTPAKTFDPGEQSADLTDSYLNALNGIDTRPGEDTKERVSTL
jgi:hypothetical protein